MPDTRNLQREYIQAIKPYLDLKHSIYSLVLPKITLFPDGSIETEYDFPQEEKDNLAKLDEMMEDIRSKFND